MAAQNPITVINIIVMVTFIYILATILNIIAMVIIINNVVNIIMTAILTNNIVKVIIINNVNIILMVITINNIVKVIINSTPSPTTSTLLSYSRPSARPPTLATKSLTPSLNL